MLGQIASPALAQSGSGGVSQETRNGRTASELRHWEPTDFYLQFDTGDVGDIKTQVQVFRLPTNPTGEVPIWTTQTDAKPSQAFGTWVVLTAPPNTFQPGYEYEWRARWWRDGDAENPSAWTAPASFDVEQASDRPGAPLPLDPVGPVAPTGVTATIETSSPGSSLDTEPIAEYRFEVTEAESTRVLWAAVVPASAAQNGKLSVALPDLDANTAHRWRAIARTVPGVDADSTFSSSPSRWRYFQTTSDVAPEPLLAFRSTEQLFWRLTTTDGQPCFSVRGQVCWPAAGRRN